MIKIQADTKRIKQGRSNGWVDDEETVKSACQACGKIGHKREDCFTLKKNKHLKEVYLKKIKDNKKPSTVATATNLDTQRKCVTKRNAMREIKRKEMKTLRQ